jgi:UDP-3-O-[3-hydroxymyristoyl] glucosamine N-acyltransferase
MQLKLQEIADLLSAPLEGDGERIVKHVTPLKAADSAALSWLGDEKYLDSLQTTQAAGVLIPPDIPVPANLTAIRVADPDLALCEVLRAIAPPRSHIAAGVAKTAVIAPDAGVKGAHIADHVSVGPGSQIGAGTQLHPGVRIGRGVTIGPDCVLWPNVVVGDYCQIGDRVVIHANSTLGTDGFGYLFRAGRHVKIPQIGNVVIENDVEIGSGVCIDRARSGETRIGTGTKIDNLVQIAHNVQIEPHCILVAQVGISGSCTIGHHAVLAGQAGIADHIHIGAAAKIGAQAGILKNVADGESMLGTPAFELRNFMQSTAGFKRLPDALKTLRELEQRVKQLESAAHD